jgi:hypothetical protein
MKKIIRKNVMFLVMAFTALTIMSGCASTPINTEKSTSGIRAAEEVGAAEVPKASLHLKLAKEELVLAKKYEANNEPLKAKSMLKRSEIDAELAVALAKERDEKTKSSAELENVRVLKKENREPSKNTESTN